MCRLTLVLITGRSTKQGVGISVGKASPEYRQAISMIELNPSDMALAGLDDGDRVRLTSEFGTTEARCAASDVPKGLAFMAFGPACNKLIGSETYASGMPDSKHVKIELRLAAGDEAHGQ